MGRVHEGVHGLGPQGWSMDLGSMFCIRPKVSVDVGLKTQRNHSSLCCIKACYWYLKSRYGTITILIVTKSGGNTILYKDAHETMKTKRIYTL